MLQDRIIFAYPTDAYARMKLFENSDKNVINKASAMLSGSGLYYIAWDGGNNKGKVNLLQVSRDTSGLSAQLQLTPAATPSWFTNA